MRARIAQALGHLSEDQREHQGQNSRENGPGRCEGLAMEARAICLLYKA
jgi:hypothetical protein